VVKVQENLLVSLLPTLSLAPVVMTTLWLLLAARSFEGSDGYGSRVTVRHESSQPTRVAVMGTHRHTRRFPIFFLTRWYSWIVEAFSPSVLPAYSQSFAESLAQEDQ
jgi:hypothetical protein